MPSSFVRRATVLARRFQRDHRGRAVQAPPLFRLTLHGSRTTNKCTERAAQDVPVQTFPEIFVSRLAREAARLRDIPSAAAGRAGTRKSRNGHCFAGAGMNRLLRDSDCAGKCRAHIRRAGEVALAVGPVESIDDVVRTGRRAHKLRVLRHAAREATLDGHCGAAILALDHQSGTTVSQDFISDLYVLDRDLPHFVHVVPRAVYACTVGEEQHQE
mmetsp:Transcript_41989/g.75388  ORF Transcript_41989/g.75388 Transcript_41989/m.75388 type:complete len:215 (-) Transcript_41989:1489-2133(-)